jgi:hypothetical protein
MLQLIYSLAKNKTYNWREDRKGARVGLDMLENRKIPAPAWDGTAVINFVN